MKIIIYSGIILLAITQVCKGQDIPVPSNYEIIDSVTGDLNNDSVDDLVVAYNTEPENEIEGVPREIIIYKLENNTWKLWKKSRLALYGSRDGGMMGDPLERIEIKKGILLVSQCGGSSWKWGFTDKYRFQNGDFYLIGYTSNAGRPGDYWRNVDFNLSTGKMIVKKEYEDSESDEQPIYKTENETLYEKDLKITLQSRQEKEIKIVTPKYGHEIYIATGK
ncbi:hypothetical protein [Marinifilum caeruleilacunae]|uniref:VCBS repeat-containing protein n=1 Tax=Marinifilum caeruleilacunae TaxID=2499076 RepID=A0ABX1X1K4_9BACT|nr:hypothetical protein [Marinifilum caeruleilacunae]NOU62292.1 hypothetical protein [Marinifilum caeruleilacunae]